MKKLLLIISVILFASCNDTGKSVIMASNISDDCKWVLKSVDGLHLEFQITRLGKGNYEYTSLNNTEDAGTRHYGKLVFDGREYVNRIDGRDEQVAHFKTTNNKYNMFKGAFIPIPVDRWRNKPQLLKVYIPLPNGETYKANFKRVAIKKAGDNEYFEEDE